MVYDVYVARSCILLARNVHVNSPTRLQPYMLTALLAYNPTCLQPYMPVDPVSSYAGQL